MQYRLAQLQIDDVGFEIRLNGVVVQTEPRVLEFIFYLLRHRERLVSKAELLETIWGKRAVSDSVLTRCACMARKTLGNPALLKTVYGRGYRWVGTLDHHQGRQAEQSSEDDPAQWEPQTTIPFENLAVS